MITKENRLKWATDVLVKAFFEGTLAKGTCTACAVGNLVASAMGGTIKRGEEGGFYCNKDNRIWALLFITLNTGESRRRSNSNNVLIDAIGFREMRDQEKANKATDAIALTGYTEDELAKVEKAYENNTKITYVLYAIRTQEQIMADQYNGLSAVFDVLCSFEDTEPTPYKAKLRREVCATY